TIVTHGAQLLGDLDGAPLWEDLMADAIATRIDPDGQGANVSQYKLEKHALTSPTLRKVKGPSPGDNGNQMEIIVKVDWADLSSVLFPGQADEVGRAVAETLLQPPTDGTFFKAFTELPMHFIGHSRGCYVNSAAIRLLAGQGVWVEEWT